MHSCFYFTVDRHAISYDKYTSTYIPHGRAKCNKIILMSIKCFTIPSTLCQKFTVFFSPGQPTCHFFWPFFYVYSLDINIVFYGIFTDTTSTRWNTMSNVSQGYNTGSNEGILSRYSGTIFTTRIWLGHWCDGI